MKQRESSRRSLPLWILLSCVAVAADPLPQIPPPMRVTYPVASTDGKGVETMATTLPGELAAVTVVNSGNKPESATLHLGSREIGVKEIAHDPVSRLEFLTFDSGQKLQAAKWNTEVGTNATAGLRTLEAQGTFPCRSTGWVKHVDGKVLPFALLSVDFKDAVPPPGTAIVDDLGAVVGIVFQATGIGTTGYVIPAEAVLRVRHDLAEGSHLVRGWLGLALHTESLIPQISRILEGSPADLAGVQVGDIIIAVGSRRVADYADAANAFFYVIPGEPIVLSLRRGEEIQQITLTPTEPPSDI
jgi:hypothetical protein